MLTIVDNNFSVVCFKYKASSLVLLFKKDPFGNSFFFKG